MPKEKLDILLYALVAKEFFSAIIGFVLFYKVGSGAWDRNIGQNGRSIFGLAALSIFVCFISIRLI